MIKFPHSCGTRLRNFLPAECVHLAHYLKYFKFMVDMYANGCIFQMRFYCFHSDIDVLKTFTITLF